MPSNINDSIRRSGDLERTNLEAHVDLCSLRYDNMANHLDSIDTNFAKIEKRFDNLDEKFNLIKDEVRHSQLILTKTLIGTAGTIVVALVSALSVYLAK